MLQAKVVKPGEVVIKEVPRPVVGDDEVLLQVHRIGVCGSDIHVYHGSHPYVEYPVIQGHELCGEVVEIGKGVSGFSIGQRAVVQPQITCGRCYPCRQGDYNICDELKVMGFQAPGGARNFWAVAAEKVIVLPEGITADEGAMVEPLAVAVRAVKYRGGEKYDRVVVLGGGTIGNLTAQVARAYGAEVLLTELNRFRANIAKKVGVDHVADARNELLEAVITAFGPDRADAIFECTGSESAIRSAIPAARKGSTIIIVGVYGAVPKVDLAMVGNNELRMSGCLMYKREEFLEAIRLIREKKVKLTPLITHRFAFEKYAEAYSVFEKSTEVMKVMIEL